MKGEITLTVGRARRVWPLLGTMTTLDRPAPVHRPWTLQRREYLDYMAFQERLARFQAVRDRTKPTGPMPGPTNMEALDARALIDQVVTAYAPEVFRAATALPLGSDVATSHERVREGLSILAVYGPGLAASAGALPMLVDLVEVLGMAVRAGERLAHLEADEVPVRRDCPACGTRSLRIRGESPWPDEWVVECRSRTCVCPELVGCPCGRQIRVPGRRHLWARAEWEALRVLDRCAGEPISA